jgi:hypothetical protein
MLRYFDIALTLSAFVAEFSSYVLQLQLLDLQLSVPLHAFLYQLLLLFFKLPLIKGIFCRQFLLVLANHWYVLLI